MLFDVRYLLLDIPRSRGRGRRCPSSPSAHHPAHDLLPSRGGAQRIRRGWGWARPSTTPASAPLGRGVDPDATARRGDLVYLVDAQRALIQPRNPRHYLARSLTWSRPPAPAPSSPRSLPSGWIFLYIMHRIDPNGHPDDGQGAHPRHAGSRAPATIEHAAASATSRLWSATDSSSPRPGRRRLRRRPRRGPRAADGLQQSPRLPIWVFFSSCRAGPAGFAASGAAPPRLRRGDL